MRFIVPLLTKTSAVSDAKSGSFLVARNRRGTTTKGKRARRYINKSLLTANVQLEVSTMVFRVAMLLKQTTTNDNKNKAMQNILNGALLNDVPQVEFNTLARAMEENGEAMPVLTPRHTVNTPQQTEQVKASIAGEIMVEAKDWKAFKRAKARENAAKAEAERLATKMQLPDATQYAANVEVPVVDGNRQRLGTFKVYWFNGAKPQPPQWRKRVT